MSGGHERYMFGSILSTDNARWRMAREIWKAKNGDSQKRGEQVEIGFG